MKKSWKPSESIRSQRLKMISWPVPSMLGHESLPLSKQSHSLVTIFVAKVSADYTHYCTSLFGLTRMTYENIDHHLHSQEQETGHQKQVSDSGSYVQLWATSLRHKHTTTPSAQSVEKLESRIQQTKNQNTQRGTTTGFEVHPSPFTAQILQATRFVGTKSLKID